jgi:hypothetical protein
LKRTSNKVRDNRLDHVLVIQFAAAKLIGQIAYHLAAV